MSTLPPRSRNSVRFAAPAAARCLTVDDDFFVFDNECGPKYLHGWVWIVGIKGPADPWHSLTGQILHHRGGKDLALVTNCL